MLKYRVVCDNGNLRGFWWAEEKTSFGWERIVGTTGEDEKEAYHLLRLARKDAA